MSFTSLKNKLFPIWRQLAALFLLLVLLVSIPLIFYFFSRHQEIINPETVTKEPEIKVVDGSTLYFGSFFESFYNKSNIDLEQSNLYIDLTMDAAMFLPDYDWQPIDSLNTQEGQYFSALNYNDFESPFFYDQVCLKSDCLEQKGNELFFNDRLLSLPTISGRLQAVSISSVDNVWLVGLVWQEEGGYRGQVYYFNGLTFKSIFSDPIGSSYSGRFGFGGDKEDFLVIYGARQGQAYRIREKNVSDLSKYFSFRPMNGGFQAKVVKSGTGQETTWYIFSLSASRPRFIKLWQNSSEEIMGAVDLSALVLGTDTKTLALMLRGKDKNNSGTELVVEEKGDYGEIVYHRFFDNGFHSDKPGQIVTLPNSQGGSSFALRQLSLADVKVDETSREGVSLLFSSKDKETNNLSEWRTVELGKKTVFRTEEINSYFIKLEFTPLANKNFSPFVSEMTFDYYCLK